MSTANGDGQNLLPRDTIGPVAGDDRVADNPPLTALHTVYLREHNRLVDVLAAQNSTWTQEQLYQRARKTVGAEIQSITFNEYLPALLGPAAPSPTAGAYNPNLNPAIFNEFAAVFERVGHSMLPAAFLRVQNNGTPASAGPMTLIDGFNNQSAIPTSADLSLFLKGLSVETQEEVDPKIITDLRVALLDAIDIQRARDHGLPDYIRWYKYEPQSHGADHIRDPASARYDASYRVSANLLNFVTEKYDKDLVRKLNAALRQGKYADDLWPRYTGQPLDTLAQEWKASLTPATKPR